MTADYPRMPEKPTLDGVETRWAKRWLDSGTYAFAGNRDRGGVYSIDTPPPTASGSLHVGHVFSYTHTDCIARYKRMQGFDVFYPMGWDDNGLPTERRVQNFYGVRCDPSLPYDPDFQPPAEPGKEQIPVSRRNFVELCERLTVEDEKAFEALWQYLGVSVDWKMTYQTIDAHSRAASQRAFLRNLARGEAYQSEAPTLWDVTFRTNIHAMFYLTKAAVPHMRPGSAIINTTSINADTPSPRIVKRSVAPLFALSFCSAASSAVYVHAPSAPMLNWPY